MSSRPSSTAGSRSRRSTSTRAGWRSTASRTTGARGRKWYADGGGPARSLRRPPPGRGLRLLRGCALLARRPRHRRARPPRPLPSRDARGRRARRRGGRVPRRPSARRRHAELGARGVAERPRLPPHSLRDPVPAARYLARLPRRRCPRAPRHGACAAGPPRPFPHPAPRARAGDARGGRRLGRGRDAGTPDAGGAPHPPWTLRMTLAEALGLLAPRIPDGTVCIHANGYVSRAGCATRDREECFYMIGSMGLAASIGLGLALARPDRRVLALDGEGHVLMNPGALASIGAAAPPNLHHVCFDNGAHASTGGQPTVSDRVRLDEVARAAGYRFVGRVETRAALAAEAPAFLAREGPAFLLVRIALGPPGPPAPRIPHAPETMTARVRRALGLPSVSEVPGDSEGAR